MVRKALILLLKIVLFPVGVVILMMFYMAVAEYGFTETVGAEIPPSFPIVVVTQQDGDTSVYMISHGLLETFKKKFPDVAFKIPPERIREFQRSINKNTKELCAANNWQLPFYAGFSMKEGSDGSQQFRTSMPPDDDFETRGWYRVVDSEIEAQHFLSYRGIGPALFATTISFMTMLAIYIALPMWRLLTWFIARHWKGRKAQR